MTSSTLGAIAAAKAADRAAELAAAVEAQGIAAATDAAGRAADLAPTVEARDNPTATDAANRPAEAAAVETPNADPRMAAAAPAVAHTPVDTSLSPTTISQLSSIGVDGPTRLPNSNYNYNYAHVAHGQTPSPSTPSPVTAAVPTFSSPQAPGAQAPTWSNVPSLDGNSPRVSAVPLSNETNAANHRTYNWDTPSSTSLAPQLDPAAPELTARTTFFNPDVQQALSRGMDGPEIYTSMIQPRVGAPRSSQIARWSAYRESIDTTPGRLAGNSRRAGDASPEVQSRVIDTLIDASQSRGLNARDTAYVLAIARYESGFNPDAAAGASSAAGVGQLIKGTGEAHGLNAQNRFDAKANSEALVDHYIQNRDLARARGLGEAHIYRIHHDGRGARKNSAGLGLANREVMPYLDKYESFVKQRLGQQPTGPAQTTPEQRVDGPTQLATEPRAQPPGAMADGVLRPRERGPEVIAVQEALNRLGHTGRSGRPLETRSGVYGLETRHAVKDFQRTHGLKADGVIGSDTLAALASSQFRSTGVNPRTSLGGGINPPINHAGAAGAPQPTAPPIDPNSLQTRTWSNISSLFENTNTPPLVAAPIGDNGVVGITKDPDSPNAISVFLAGVSAPSPDVRVKAKVGARLDSPGPRFPDPKNLDFTGVNARVEVENRRSGISLFVDGGVRTSPGTPTDFSVRGGVTFKF